MLSPAPQIKILDIPSTPEIRPKDTIETITEILTKSAHDRDDDELTRLSTYLQCSSSFKTFWGSVPKGAHLDLLKGLRYMETRPNKSIFSKGGESIKGFYYILSGSICALTLSKEGGHLSEDVTGPTTGNLKGGNIPTKTDILSTLSTFDFSTFGMENNDVKSQEILNLYPHHQFSAVLGQGDCFGELASNEYDPKSAILITREICEFAYLSLPHYKKTLNEYNKRTHQENLDFIRNISLVQEWSSEDLTALLKSSKTLSFNRNHTLYDIGDPCEFVYLIYNGEVEITKETRLDIDDEEIFDKASLAKQSQDVDRARLANLNHLWKKKFSMAKRQQQRMVLLGACQSFGEDEVISQASIRSSKAVVKSLTAKILVVPIENILRNTENEPTTQTHARSSSISQLPLNGLSQERVGEGDFSKYVQAYNQQDSQREILSNRHKRSASYGNIKQPKKKVLGESNLISSKLNFYKNMELPSVPNLSETKENSQLSRIKSPAMKSPRTDFAISSKDQIKIGGINRLWESNRHNYFSKGKKAEQTKSNNQVDSIFLRQKSITNFLPDTARQTYAGKAPSSRQLDKPVIGNDYANIIKKKMTMSQYDQIGVSMNGQTPSSRSKEVEEDPQNDPKGANKFGMSKLLIEKTRGNSCEAKTCSNFYIKKLGQMINGTKSFREHNTASVKLDDGWNGQENNIKLRLVGLKSPMNSTRDLSNNQPKIMAGRKSLSIIDINQFIS